MSTILLVENDRHYAALVDTVARKMSHTTIHAQPGENLYHLLETNEISLVLIDLPLPYGESGWNAIEELKQSGITNTPIIAMSVIAREADHERAIYEGCTEYVRKPHSSQVIGEKIHAYLGGGFMVGW